MNRFGQSFVESAPQVVFQWGRGNDADGLPEEPALPADVAAENGHGPDAQAQGEEGLAHGGVHRLPQAEVPAPSYIRLWKLGTR